MKNFFLNVCVTLATVWSVWSQNKSTSPEKPKGKWQVSKEYDDKGNMTSYDSVYVWSSDDNNMKMFSFSDKDSLPANFRQFFRHFSMPDFQSFEPDSLGMGFRDFFDGFDFPFSDENDSIKKDFKHLNRLHPEGFDFQKQMDDMQKQIDELRQQLEKKNNTEATEPKKQQEHKL